MADLTFMIFSEEQMFAERARELLADSGHAHVVGVTDDADALRESIRTLAPEALFVDLGYAPHEVLDLLGSLPAPRPQVVACGPQEDSRVILRALQQGAREYLPPAPDAEQVAQAVERISLTSIQKPETDSEAPLIAVMGAKGGVGATVVASQLAASLQRLAGPTAIVDLNFPLGDVALHFDVAPSYTLADVASADHFDSAVLRELLVTHESGVSILAAPTRIEDTELVRDRHVASVFEALRQEMKFVVADVSRSCNEASMRALDMADYTLLVTLQDVPTLNHTRAHRDLLCRMGHRADRIRAVVNRHSPDAPVGDADVREFLGEAPACLLPNDYATTVASVNEGRPVADVSPGCELDRAFSELARKCCDWSGVAIEAPAERPRGIRSRLQTLIGRG